MLHRVLRDPAFRLRDFPGSISAAAGGGAGIPLLGAPAAEPAARLSGLRPSATSAEPGRRLPLPRAHQRITASTCRGLPAAEAEALRWPPLKPGFGPEGGGRPSLPGAEQLAPPPPRAGEGGTRPRTAPAGRAGGAATRGGCGVRMGRAPAPRRQRSPGGHGASAAPSGGRREGRGLTPFVTAAARPPATAGGPLRETKEKQRKGALQGRQLRAAADEGRAKRRRAFHSRPAPPSSPAGTPRPPSAARPGAGRVEARSLGRARGSAAAEDPVQAASAAGGSGPAAPGAPSLPPSLRPPAALPARDGEVTSRPAPEARALPGTRSRPLAAM